MSRKHGPVTIWSQYLGTRLAAMLLTMFDVDTNLRTASQIGRTMYAWDRRHRERACGSISTSFPEWSAQKVDRIARQSFEHFMQLAVEVLHIPRVLLADTWPQRLRTTAMDKNLVMLNARQPMIFITGHLGNWEVTGHLLGMLGHRIEAIARPLDNHLINHWLMSKRQANSLRIITKWNATERMVRVLDDGGTLGFIADQNAGDKGLFVPFFGRLASTYKSIGLLALNRQLPVVCGYAQRVGPGFRYEMGCQDIIWPQDWANQRDPLFYITARYSRALELMIRRFPEQYLWMHRRWKSRPRHERRGKPMPHALQRNLEELPWMDQDQLDRLTQPAAPS
jgi:KDO2-lipid IV(A) lauroyltransferase